MRAQEEWEGAEKIDLLHYWNVVDRKKWAILSLSTVVALIAALVAYAMTPIYRASATILIESAEANVVSIKEVYGLDTRTQQYYLTQFEILNSRPLAEKVVGTLDLLKQPEFGESRPSKLDWHAWVPFDLAPAKTRTPSNQLQTAIDAYYRNLTVEPVKDTQLVRVHFDSEEPELAARIANAHAQAYMDSMLEARVAVTESAATWMATRLNGMEQDLRAAEQDLQSFREQEQIVDVEGLQALPTREVNELTSRLVEVRAALSQAQIADRQIANLGDGSLEDLQSIPAILKDDVVRNFQEAEAMAKQKVAELEKRYGPLHPIMIAAQAELARATESIRAQHSRVSAAIRREYEAAQAEEAALVRALDLAQQRYQEVGSKESELNALQRAVDTKRQLYDLFYNRISETNATGDLNTGQARIVSPAVTPSNAVSPNKKLIVGLAFALTLLAGVVLSFVLEGLNNTIRSAADVEEKLRTPLLGMVPLLKTKQKNCGNVFFDKAETAFNEAIRTIRTGISLAILDHPHKVILVASSVAGEGKSTVALNLAHAFAQLETVLVIDADLRRPSIGRDMNISKGTPGLSEVLKGRAKLAEGVLRGKKGYVDVISSGSIVPNPLELLSSSRLDSALKVLRRAYDRIIIDSPPSLPVSDALILSKYADAVVFVVKCDATSVRQIAESLHLFARVDARVLGVVVNQLDLRKARKYSDYGYGAYVDLYESSSA